MPQITIALCDSTFDSLEAVAEDEYAGNTDEAVSDLLGAWLARQR
ncbi:MAG: hypothetical protein R3324_04045 [Halobacteriales archaeon]|nr:hypothetical protein [Halobacteriales archaeon]